MVILVDSYRDSNGITLPARFYLGRYAIEAVSLLDRWLEMDHSYYKVRGSDGALYILRHDMDDGRWELVLFDNGDLDPRIDPLSISSYLPALAVNGSRRR